MDQHQRALLARRAEQRACRHLWRRGWRIVARNWTTPGGELDIVASRWRTLLVVEVRYRTDGSALASIDGDKLARTASSAKALVRSFRLQRYRLRIDLIGFDARGRLARRRDVLAHGRLGV
ncbi:MAG: YraN family protein [Planctomycetota bacterium]|nr:YraN family protein [Planctomycetota bacterium]